MKFSNNNIIMLRAFLMFVFCVSYSFEFRAQQNWSNTQYAFNLYDVNLAYAGNHGVSSFGLRNRSQWMGFDGAPQTQQLSWHAPVFKQKIGIGANFQMDKIGLRVQQSARVSAAYKIALSKGYLSAGFGVGVVRQVFDKEATLAQDNQDTQLLALSNPILIPVIDAAVFFNTTNFYIGTEFGRIDRSSYNYSSQTEARNYYHIRLVAGYKYKLGDNDLVEVSSLTKYAEGSKVQFEGTFQYTKANFLSLGVGYRVGTAAYILASCNITPQFRFGLSYDFNAGVDVVKNSGGLEAFLGYNLMKNSSKSIRYF